MAILSDKDIRKLVQSHQMLDPFSEGVQEGGVISYGLSHAGYDLRLSGSKVLIFKNSFGEVINPKKFRNPKYCERVFDELNNIPDHEPVLIPAGGYILATSLELIRMPRHIKGRCVGKSTYARCGLLVNTTPLEPGWIGHLTLELANSTPCQIAIYVGEGLCQLEFEELTSMPEVDYQMKAGKYQDQTQEPIPARIKE